MLDDLFGSTTASILNLLPVEVITFLVVSLVLYKTGTLERMAVILRLWIKSHIDAGEARKHFQSELLRIETEHDAELERIIAQAQETSRTADNLANLRMRDELWGAVQDHIVYLQNRVELHEAFMFILLAQSSDLTHLEIERLFYKIIGDSPEKTVK